MKQEAWLDNASVSVKISVVRNIPQENRNKWLTYMKHCDVSYQNTQAVSAKFKNIA